MKVVRTPFLRKPFSGSYNITAYFDHHWPNMDWDDQIIINTGLQANAIDGIASRSPTFRGGYWASPLNDHVYYDGHDAYDYDTPLGTTILAAADGEVIFAGGIDTGCATPAKLIVIQHANDYRTIYLHLDRIGVNLGPVSKGQPIGISGATGCVTGPHLHFAVKHKGYDTDPYGWGGAYLDPLLEYSAEEATWLWEEEGPAPPTGHLISPTRGSFINGPVTVTVEPEGAEQAIAKAFFYAGYDDAWHEIGVDTDEGDGWSVVWDPAAVRDQDDIWFHAWLYDAEGRYNSGLTIVTDVTLDRVPPTGRIVSPSSGATVNEKVVIYAEAEDERGAVDHVDFYAGHGEIWHKIGRDTDGSDGWSVVWDASGVRQREDISFLVCICDRAGNCNHHIKTVTGVTLDEDIPGGTIVWPHSGWATDRDVIVSLETDGGEETRKKDERGMTSETVRLAKVVFYARYRRGSTTAGQNPARQRAWGASSQSMLLSEQEWYEIGVDTDGSDGWSVSWDISGVRDQSDVRFRAQVYDEAGRYNDGLGVISGVTLDRTPPSGAIAQPKEGSFINGDWIIKAWASDAGSGVARVIFQAGYDDQWHEIGVDTYGGDGWLVVWDVSDVRDQEDVWFQADIYDQLGYHHRTATVTGVTLDQVPPAGHIVSPLPNTTVEGPLTIVLQASDELSGLDRVIFYADYGGRWHGLGADTDGRDGWSLVWDTAEASPGGEVRFTAWIYDKAGNHYEVESVTGVRVSRVTLDSITALDLSLFHLPPRGGFKSAY